MDVHNLKRALQGLFSEGLVIIVGSGLSCAEGLPGMGALADELKVAIPPQISSADQASWDQVKARLDTGLGLEDALHEISVSEDLESAIVQVTADFMLGAESTVLSSCLNGNKVLRFSLLLSHLSPVSPKRINVITTNYDRLIEFAVEFSGWGADTGFVGRIWGKYNPEESEKSLAQKVVQQRKTTKLQYRDHVRLHKPHGSLDWFETPAGIISSTLPISARRLLITPGVGKYRQGYKQPFDSHREGANAAIDGATAFLCIGYGFNDEHLQTHLTPRLKDGVPALLLNHGLTDKAVEVIQSSANTIALIHSDKPLGTSVVTQRGKDFIPGEQWWDLEQFIKGVLEP